MASTQVSEADVAAAEDAARQAEQLALSLEQQIAAGDDSVTAEELEARRSEARFAVLRVQGVRAKLAVLMEPERQRALAALKAEVDAYVADAGERLADGLQAVLDAREAFFAVAAEHDSTIVRWAQWAQQLNVPQVDGSLRTREEHAGIGLGRTGLEALIVGKRRLKPVNAAGREGFLATVLANSVPVGSYPVEVYLDQLRAIDGDEEDA